MNTTQYLTDSARTAPDKDTTYHTLLVSDVEFIAEATATVLKIKELDAMKKALVYGKDPGQHIHAQDVGDVFDPILNMDMVHAILGIVTKAKKLLEMLIDKKVAEMPHKFKDEAGDLLWYLALGIRENETTFEELMEKNIAKLRVRFPVKFESDLAIHKNDAQESLVFQS